MKRMKLMGIVFTVICVIAMAASIITIASSCQKQPEAEGPRSEVDVIDIAFCNQHPMEDPMNGVVNVAWGKWLEEESDGRIKLNILPLSQAAPSDELYDAARTGIVDIACQTMGLMPGRFVAEEVAELPFVFDWPASASVAMTLMALYEEFPYIQQEHTDVKVLLYHAASTTHVHTVNKPIHTMEDMEGMVMAVTGPNQAEIVERLGGSAVLMNIAEIYDALAKGVVDGNLDNWTCSMIFGWGDLWNYSTQASLCAGSWIHVMNLDTWASLSPDQQKLFQGENAWRMAGLFGYIFDKSEGGIRAGLEESYLAKGKPKIYSLTAEEEARWAEAIMPIREDWLSRAEAAGAPAQEILDAALKYSAQYSYDTLQTTDWLKKQEQILHDWGAVGY